MLSVGGEWTPGVKRNYFAPRQRNYLACAWFGILVIPNNEPVQTITLGPDEQKLQKDPQH